MLNNSWFKKEKPLPTMIGLGGGATGIVMVTKGGLSGPGGMVASGGITQDYSPGPTTHYRSHTFYEPGTFTVDFLSNLPGTYPDAVDLLVIGEAQSGINGTGGGGGGGGYTTGIDSAFTGPKNFKAGTGGDGTIVLRYRINPATQPGNLCKATGGVAGLILYLRTIVPSPPVPALKFFGPVNAESIPVVYPPPPPPPPVPLIPD
jgi:hypothetical protein